MLQYNIDNEIGEFPVKIELPNYSIQEFIKFYKEGNFDELLTKFGSIKFSGLNIDSTQTFGEITNGISKNFLDYVDGNSPRTKLEGKVYTSTEYDNTQKITMHNELSYSSTWPKKIFFSCVQPAAVGGETTLADGRLILKEMNPSIVKEIEKKGIVYIRNLHGGIGVGPSWQDTFETTDKSVVEKHCEANNIKFQWYDENLRLYQNSKGIINHHITGEKVWFNQIDQFHPSHLGEDIFETLNLICESPEEFPMYVTFGDGSEIPSSTVAEIMETIEKVTEYPVWDKGELLVVDNELVCHGRNSFEGDRLVLVAMST